ncbi:HAD family hydrolase [Loktanella sp. D2R18]|uniref:sulfotransferase-like domain-containing protein n=1 Tax=Rhodobacterales TaxID=204455 RepID=UPI000DEADDB5|nr:MULTISPECIES: HAD family hydrolase [Rhodobacterales]MDO6590443.1 HAD family hydrolase [Yoonia sp. 1_MG-2023]RBW41166.1 HAD family hydrolase [Loktanella sp. D2R18]
MRLAMWSGPRNLSTAMMYSFGNRSDFAVWDEPFYAAYLAMTGLHHPMRDEILTAHETDKNNVAVHCLDTTLAQKPHFYMKHMAHHMIDGMPLDWAQECVNVHLIRHPARVIASYGVKRSEMTFDDIGFAQQAAIYDKLGGYVIDSADIRANPEKMLRKLCGAIGLDFGPAMLSWQAGPHVGDGIWASHWYNAVHQSTGFAGAEGRLPELDGAAADLCAQALPYYERLAALKL